MFAPAQAVQVCQAQAHGLRGMCRLVLGSAEKSDVYNIMRPVMLINPRWKREVRRSSHFEDVDCLYCDKHPLLDQGKNYNPPPPPDMFGLT